MWYLLLVSLLWAFSFGLIKTHLAGIDSAFVAATRLALSLLVFLPFLRPRATSGRSALALVAIGAVQFGLMYLAYLASFHTLAAYQVALLTIVTPILVCLCDDAIERRIRWQALLAAALAVAGAGVIVARQSFGQAEWIGVGLVQLSNLCFALGQVLYRRWRLAQPQIRDREVFGWLYLGAAATTIPLALSRTDILATARSLSGTQLGVILYLGVLASGAAFFLWNLGAARVSAGSLAVMNNAKTPLGVAAALLVFDERTDLPRLLVGGALILVAALYAQRLEAKVSR